MIILGTLLILNSTMKSYSYHTDGLQEEHQVDYTLKYIEKRLREFNQQNIIFDSTQNIFKGKNDIDENAFIDLGGKTSYKKNTMIYFYRSRQEIRVNKNTEHNVLVKQIEDIIVRELVEGKLIEIEVIAAGGEYSNKIKLNLDYRKD